MNSGIVSYGVIGVIMGIIWLTPIGDWLRFAPYGEGGGSIRVLTSVVFIAGGIVLVLWGVIAKPKKKYQIKVCGNCVYFQKPECVREEKLPNAMPCEKFLQKQNV